MTNEETIFHRALEKPAGERAALLDEACQADAELRGRVERLLAEHERQQSFVLDTPPAGLDATTFRPISEQPGSTIGPYKLLQQIGEGGMGVVFMAEQTEPLQRTVALKIIKPGMDTRSVVARFEAERQAVAMMDHPNIAKVLDAAATDSGRPYFVMELVKGVPITKYCDEKHLPLRERLELFMQVCQAVQHGHQKGIIHRDIKPNNVLVADYDNQPVPKVIDFGVAKATAHRLTERTMFTEFGQVLGTMEYMSPEQAKLNQLDIDTRSDIYSLGVLLYELLAGSTPFEGTRLKEAAYDEMLRIIREEEPPKPSTRLSSLSLGERAGVRESLASIAANRNLEPARLSKDVQGELDWIVMKALEKDRNRRYETASGFAADIERHLRDEPVEAGPPSAAYRFRKFAKRNKAALLVATAAIATLLLLVLGLAVSNRMIVAERNETAKALKQKARALALAEKQRERSDANFLKATVAVRDIITGTALGRDNVPVTLRRKFSDQATKFYESLLQEDSPDPSLLCDTGVGYRTIGMLHSSWGEFEQAEKSFRRAIDILDRLSTKYPAVQQYRHQLGYAHMEFARMLNQTGRSQEAQPVIERGIKVYEKLVAETPNKVEFLANLTLFYADAITTHGNSGAAEEVEKSYRRVAELLEQMGKEALVPNLYQLDVVGRASVGHRQRDVAFALRRIGRFDDAEQMFRNAVRTFEVLRSEDPGTVGHWHFLADTHREVGLAMLDRKKPKEAEREFRQAIEIHEQRAAKFPADRVNDLEWAAAYFDLARLLIKSGRAQEARPLVTRGVEVSPTNEGQADKLNVQIQLGNLLREAGEFDQALARYSEVIATKPDRAETWVGRGQCYLAKAEFDKAAEDFSAAIKLEPHRSDGWSGRAFAYFHLQQWDKAVSDFSKAIDLAPQVHANWLHRGHTYLQLAQWENAAADFTKVIEGWPDDAGGSYWRALAYAQLNHPVKALADLRQAIAKGYKNVEQLKNDPMLDPLRSDEDFKKLLITLEKEKE